MPEISSYAPNESQAIEYCHRIVAQSGYRPYRVQVAKAIGCTLAEVLGMKAFSHAYEELPKPSNKMTEAIEWLERHFQQTHERATKAMAARAAGTYPTHVSRWPEFSETYSALPPPLDFDTRAVEFARAHLLKHGRWPTDKETGAAIRRDEQTVARFPKYRAEKMRHKGKRTTKRGQCLTLLDRFVKRYGTLPSKSLIAKQAGIWHGNLRDDDQFNARYEELRRSLAEERSPDPQKLLPFPELEEAAPAQVVEGSGKGEQSGESGVSPPKPLYASDAVKLFGQGKPPLVRGCLKEVLTVARYNVVQALVQAGTKGLTKDELDKQSGHTEARKILKVVARLDADWADVIAFPEGPGKHYRIK